MGFSRQEYWSGLPFPSPGDLPDPGIEPGSPTLQADSLSSEPLGEFTVEVYKDIIQQCYLRICKHFQFLQFPCGLDSKESACSVGDPGSIPESGRSPGKGNGNPLQYSCLENSMDRKAW